jgi:hypothetical protein
MSGLGEINSLLFHLFEAIHRDNGNAEALRETNILTSGGGENHIGLQSGGPDDWVASIANDIPNSGLGSGGIFHSILLKLVACKVTVNMDLKQLGYIRMQDDALVFVCLEVPAQILDCIRMQSPGIVGKASALVHCICDL